MPRQPASRCCEIVRRRIQFRSEGIWITDGILANAFERYCHVSKIHRRLASNVPGPLESRRRLGKRRMTDLGVQIHPSLPNWALPFIPDHTQWEWLPPNHAFQQARDGAGNIDSSQSPLAQFSSWLAGLGEQDTAVAEDSSISVAVLERKRSSKLFLTELSALRKSFESAPLDELHSRFDNAYDQFKQQLVLAALSPEEAVMMFDMIREGLAAHFPLSDHMSHEDLYIRLYTAIIDGITSCKVLQPQDLGVAFWSTVMMGLSDLISSSEFCGLFTRVMTTLPDNFVGHIPQEISTIILKICQRQDPVSPHKDAASLAIDKSSHFSGDAVRHLAVARNALKAGEHGEFSSMMDRARFEYRQARKYASSAKSMLFGMEDIELMAPSLSVLHPQQHEEILENVTEGLLDYAFHNHATGQRMFHRWVYLLARLPQIRQESLLKVLADSSHIGLGITGKDFCEILINQWESRGYLSKPVLSRFRALCLEAENPSLAALARALFQTQRDIFPLLVSLWKFLKVLGHESRLVDAIREESITHFLPLTLLELLARSSRDFQIAVDLKSIYDDETPGADSVTLMWPLACWEPYADDMATAIGDSLTPDQIYYALDIDRYRSTDAPTTWGKFFRGQKYRHQKVGERTVSLVTKLALYFANASDMSDREAFARVWHCWRFIRLHNYPPSLALSGALYHAVTRELAEGQPGRTTRMRWFLVYVRKQYGDQVALDCGLALQQWRTANYQQQTQKRQ